jgi:hypothetical protein
MSAINTVVEILCLGGQTDKECEGNSPLDCFICINKYKNIKKNLEIVKDNFIYSLREQNFNTCEAETFLEFTKLVKQLVNKLVVAKPEPINIEVVDKPDQSTVIKQQTHKTDKIIKCCCVVEDYPKYINDIHNQISIYTKRFKFTVDRDRFKTLIYNMPNNINVLNNDGTTNNINIQNLNKLIETNEIFEKAMVHIFINPSDKYNDFKSFALNGGYNLNNNLSHDFSVELFLDFLNDRYEILRHNIYKRIKKDYIENLIDTIDENLTNYIGVETSKKINAARTGPACILICAIILIIMVGMPITLLLLSQ